MATDSYFSKSHLYITLAFMILNLPGCSEQSENSMKTSSESQAAQIEKTAAKQPASNNGTVKSVVNAGGYSYIEVDINGDVFWIATAISHIKPGEKIFWSGHAIMANFKSKSLDRVFDQILFVDRVLPVSAMASNQHQGTVIEALDASGYSYIQVDEQGKKVWLAAPTTKLDQGQTIRWNSGEPMRNFSSKSLKRSFKEIFFVSRVEI